MIILLRQTKRLDWVWEMKIYYWQPTEKPILSLWEAQPLHKKTISMRILNPNLNLLESNFYLLETIFIQ